MEAILKVEVEELREIQILRTMMKMHKTRFLLYSIRYFFSLLSRK
jgi:hypothetical protein